MEIEANIASLAVQVGSILLTHCGLEMLYGIICQGLPFPTAQRPGASQITSGASGFGQIFLLYFI